MSEQGFGFRTIIEKERLMGMSFEALNFLLMQVSELPASAQREDYIGLIMEVMRERADNPYGLSDEIIQSEKEDFDENYCGNVIDFAEDSVPESPLFSASSQKISKKKPLPRVLRGAAIAAVIAVLFCCVVSAFRGNTSRIFAKWGNGTLTFYPEEHYLGQSGQNTFRELKKELRQHTSLSLVPDYDPRGTTFESLETDILSKWATVTAAYSHESGGIYFHYTLFESCEDLPAIELQINDRETTVHTVGGTRYYISRNIDAVNVVWFADTIMCTIWGDFTIEEAIQMVDSMNRE